MLSNVLKLTVRHENEFICNVLRYLDMKIINGGMLISVVKLIKISLLGCFLHFLKRTNCTKSCKGSYLQSL